MSECLNCDCYNLDYGCEMSSLDKWYACPIESSKSKNKKLLDDYIKWLDYKDNLKSQND